MHCVERLEDRLSIGGLSTSEESVLLSGLLGSVSSGGPALSAPRHIDYPFPQEELVIHYGEVRWSQGLTAAERVELTVQRNALLTDESETLVTAYIIPPEGGHHNLPPGPQNALPAGLVDYLDYSPTGSYDNFLHTYSANGGYDRVSVPPPVADTLYLTPTEHPRVCLDTAGTATRVYSGIVFQNGFSRQAANRYYLYLQVWNWLEGAYDTVSNATTHDGRTTGVVTALRDVADFYWYPSSAGFRMDFRWRATPVTPGPGLPDAAQTFWCAGQ